MVVSGGTMVVVNDSREQPVLTLLIINNIDNNHNNHSQIYKVSICIVLCEMLSSEQFAVLCCRP